jgi:hypothetical protein
MPAGPVNFSKKRSCSGRVSLFRTCGGAPQDELSDFGGCAYRRHRSGNFDGLCTEGVASSFKRRQ